MPNNQKRKRSSVITSDISWQRPDADDSPNPREQSSVSQFLFESSVPTARGRTTQSRRIDVPLSPEKKKAKPSIGRVAIDSTPSELDALLRFPSPSVDPEPPADPEPPDINDSEEEPEEVEVLPDRHSWSVHDRDDYLAEMLFTEGRGYACLQKGCAAGSLCPSEEKVSIPQYRCRDCINGGLLCQCCIVRTHASLPFHQIEKWGGGFFSSVTLKDLGLRVQLGHAHGIRCVNPIPRKDFVILDVTAQHTVSLDFCGCQSAVDRARQLLRSGFYPATTSDPRTACTFNLLRHYGFLSSEGDFSTWEMYRTLLRGSDNTGTVDVPDRYSPLCEVFRQWKHLQLHKRAGRAHSPSGVDGTSPGELALLCPACPQFGINTLAKTPENEWLNTEFVGIDANFRLKRFNVSSVQRDPALNKGGAYMVNGEDYTEFLKNFTDTASQPKTSACSQFKAIQNSDTNAGKRIAVNGIAAVDCIRHGLKKPLSMADISQGEKYVHMDYCYFSAITGKTPKKTPEILTPGHRRRIVTSYDIACQWSVSLWERRKHMPEDLAAMLHDPTLFVFLVPKFHLPAHVDSCRLNWSFNTTYGVGRTDGEAPERNWSYLDRFAGATRQMGPGTRADFLDCICADWNWRKICAFFRVLLRKFEKAILMAAKHLAAFDELNSVMQQAHIKLWTKQVKAWEKDRTASNPYQTRYAPVMSQKDLRQQRQAEEMAAIQNGKLSEMDGSGLSPFMFIATGLEIEEEKCRLLIDLRNVDGSAMDIEHSRLSRRTITLSARINDWLEAQDRHCPEATGLRKKAEQQSKEPPSALATDLRLPSDLPLDIKCNPKLVQHEWDLRVAGAHDALEGVRKELRSRVSLNNLTKRFSRGQKAATRSNQQHSAVNERMNYSANRYRHARNALKQLLFRLDDRDLPAGLLELHDTDLRVLSEAEDGQTEGTRTISWIWKVVGVSDNAQDDDSLRDALRLEWLMSRARAARWKEEIALLLEEMSRVMRFFTWKSLHWETSAGLFTSQVDPGSQRHPAAINGPLVDEGRRAYALEQASLYRRLTNRCVDSWKDLPTTVEAALNKGLVDQVIADPDLVKKYAQEDDEDDSEDDDTGMGPGRGGNGRFDAGEDDGGEF